ncbi:GNAT family N-acetyltransferase [Enterobacter cloacae complex sp. SHL020]|uniref:GNAT family N-acetyltransferase n=1 Tax=Enterobacter cloacae complex sp. SHL020 TaxID=3412401 RepID=UPI003BA36233
MEGIHIDICDVIAADDYRIVENGLNGFNDNTTGYCDRQPLGVIVRDSHTGKAQGGMIGRTSLGLMFIDLFWLQPELRFQGLGKEILTRFESEGKKRGCLAGVLYTISFQAPEFYRKYGWEVFGEINCQPEGSSRIFMKKTL